MSNQQDSFEAPAETGAAEGTAPTTGGEGTPEAAPEPSYLDTDEYGGHHVRLKVDGEEVSVPLSEAMAGYSRQADYTRKTQALAERERAAQFGMTLAQALENNPVETMRILQERYAAQEQQQQEEPDWTDDPNEARFRQLEAWQAQSEQQQAAQELRVAVGVLQQRYGEDFNPQEVVAEASRQGRIDLEGVYKEMAFDRYWQGQQAAREVQSAEEAARVQAKTQASTIHTGNGASNTVAPEQPGSFPTIEDAWNAAKQQLGMV